MVHTKKNVRQIDAFKRANLNASFGDVTSTAR